MLDQILIFELQNQNATAFESIAAMFFLFFGFGLIVFSIARYILEIRPEQKKRDRYKEYLEQEENTATEDFENL